MTYYDIAIKKARELRERGCGNILAIESSCDETAAAVTRGFKTLGEKVHSQIDLHEKYGGVVPEIASRDHVRMMDFVVDDALSQAGMSLSDIDAVAVTYGPGLVGALLCGVSYAKALAYSLSLPLYAVNHIEGHICANYMAHEELKPPYICLVASGGHSHIVRVDGDGEYRLIGKTRDDAAGEAFDKAARVLGLGYPGGPKLDALAQSGDADAFVLPTPRVEGYDYSFSGLKTALLQACARAEKQGGYRREDAAAAFQRAVVTQLRDKLMAAALDQGVDSVAVAGGVAANSGLRKVLAEACSEKGLGFFVPPLSLCTDNARMIGAAAHVMLRSGAPSPLTLNAQPSLRLKYI
ncbi:MAG: tRNA (adenosine(37)-N6)-threonylcarbamoyltransferase complex transferase subunit TsaD [Christensenellales bacterium]|jgi:N6-L-threonylcarbamoyladenine synthase